MVHLYWYIHFRAEIISQEAEKDGLSETEHFWA